MANINLQKENKFQAETVSSGTDRGDDDDNDDAASYRFPRNKPNND